MTLKTTPTVRARLVAGVAIFLLAFGVRILTWHDTRLEVGKIQTSVVGDYQRIANLIHDGGIRSFFSSTSALADLNNLGHPPGYSIVLAGIYSITGQSHTAVQMCQIAADALCAVLLFLIVAELLPLSAGVIVGLLAAFSPQLAWNSVLLLPDSISVLPMLLAVYMLTRAVRNPRLLSFIVVGLLIGVSCWLRANTMLLTFFAAVAVLLLVQTARRWQFAAAVICGTLLIVLPLTIRNAIVFHRFIPLSLGAGQTFLEGIADYDKQGRFGIPSTDVGIMKQESEIYQRPEYYGTLFNPDGVERERARLSRGFAVIRSHPFWFAGVMAKRASSMVRLERSRLISSQPAITHALQPNSIPSPGTDVAELIRMAKPAGSVQREFSTGSPLLRIDRDNSKYGVQARWALATRADTDYVLETAVQVSRDRTRISIVSAADEVLSSTVVDAQENTNSEDQPFVPVRLAFVADANPSVVVSNEASQGEPSQIRLVPFTLHDLGPGRLLWTRYPRWLIHAVQKFFLTAVILPLSVIGLLIVIFRKQRSALLILSLVPIYFFLVQSIVHTEYRYVLAVVYFMFAFAAVTLGCGIQMIINRLGRISRRTRSGAESVPSGEADTSGNTQDFKWLPNSP